MRVLQNLGPFSFKFHHSMIGPLHAIPSFFVFDIVMRNIFLKKRKKEKKYVIFTFET
jgi:hypothetical protein